MGHGVHGGGGGGGESVVVRELLTILGFNLNETGFKRAEGGFKSLIGFATELAHRALHVGHQLEQLAVNAATAGASAQKSGIKLGLTAEQVQELAFAEGRTTELSSGLATGLFRLQKSAEEARLGSKSAGKGFQRMGINVRDAATGHVKPTIELLEDISEKFVEIKDPSQRAAFAFRVFGRASQDLIPFLAKGKEGIEALRERARELGVVISNEDAAASKEFIEGMREMKAAINGVWTRLGLALIPAFKKLEHAQMHLFEKMKPFIDKGIKVLATVVEGVVDGWLAFTHALVENAHLLVFVGGIIATIMLPRLLALGYAAVATALRTIVAWTAAAAPFVALAIVIAAVALLLDDVYFYATGGKSAIGDLFDEFLNAKIDPYNNPFFWALQQILDMLHEAFSLVDRLANAFRDPQLGPVITGKTTPEQAAQIKYLRGLAAAGETTPIIERSVTTLPTRQSDFAGTGFGADVYSPSVTVTVDASGNAQPGAVGTAVAGSVKDALSDHYRESLRQLQSPVKY